MGWGGGPGQKNSVMEASTGRTLCDRELEAGLKRGQRRDAKPFCQGTSQIGGAGGWDMLRIASDRAGDSLALADLTPHTFQRASWKPVEKLPCPAQH